MALAAVALAHPGATIPFELLALKFALLWAGALALLATAPGMLFRRERPTFGRAGLAGAAALAGLLLLTLASSAWAPSARAADSRRLEAALLVAWALGVGLAAGDGPGLRALCLWWVGAGVAAALGGLAARALPPGTLAWRGTAFPSGNPNTHAVILVSAMAVAAGLLPGEIARLRARAAGARWTSALAALCLATSTARLLQTGSRTALVALAGAAVVLAICLGGRKLRAAAVAVAAAGALAALVLTAAVVARPERLGPGSTVAVRASIWRAAVRMLAERPVLGHGAGAFAVRGAGCIEPEARLNPQLGEPDSAHNEILEVAAETGLPGAVLFLVAVVLAGVSAWRALSSRAAEARGAVAGIAAAGVALLGGASLGPDARFPDGAAFIYAAIGALLFLRGPDAPSQETGRSPVVARRIAQAALGALAVLAWLFTGGREISSSTHEMSGRRLMVEAAADRSNGRDADALSKLRRACGEFDLAAQAAPRFQRWAAALDCRAKAQFDAGDWSGASATLQRLAREMPVHLPTLRRMAASLRLSSRSDEALAAAARALRLAPYRRDIVSECSQILAAGSLDEADARVARSASARALKGGDARLLRSLARSARGLRAQALAELNGLDERDCSIGWPAFEKALLLAGSGDFEGALREISAHVARHPRDAAAYWERSGMSLAAGRAREEAIGDLRLAVTLNPGLRDVVCDLASELVRAGRPGEALRVLDEHMSLQGPEVSPERVLLHARLLAASGNVGAAARLLDSAAMQLPENAARFRAEAARLAGAAAAPPAPPTP